MTDPVTHVLLHTNDTSEAAITTLNFMKNVENVTVVPGGLLVIFEREMRDESEGYGLFAQAVRRFDFVTAVTPYSGRWMSATDGRTLIVRIIKDVLEAAPAVPQDVSDQKTLERYVADIKSWKSALKLLRSSLQ